MPEAPTPEFVYILCTYDEYGPQDVTATLDRKKLPEMLCRYVDGDKLDEARKHLKRVLEKSDDLLSTTAGGSRTAGAAWSSMSCG